MKRMSKPLILGVVLSLLLSLISSSSASYTFDGVPTQGYYTPTNYELRYGARYHYGGMNPSKFQVGQLLYGTSGVGGYGVMDQAYPLDQPMSTQEQLSTAVIENQGSDLFSYPGIEAAGSWVNASVEVNLFTSSAGMEQADGSIGTVMIPSLGITRKVWEGETTDSMARGMGHYSSTSAWDGNVGLCVHNRGSTYAAGEIRNLNEGDTIIYQTVFGTRSYAVTSVAVIANDDWSFLQPTSDNRLTITTCLANHPESRVCVQTIEI